MWTTPKTDWKSSDFYNIEDWRRVRSNLEHIYNWMLDAGFKPPSLLITDLGRDYEELPYVYLVNNMEANLEGLRTTFGVTFTEDTSRKTWYDRLDIMYKSNPTYQDWTRWEVILKRVYESIQYIDTYLFTPICGTCNSSSNRILVRFSRGR